MVSPIIKDRYPSSGHHDWAHTVIRPAEAKRLEIIPDGTLRFFPLCWHHQIPFNTLRDFWNYLYVIANENLLMECINLFSQRSCDKHLIKKLSNIKSKSIENQLAQKEKNTYNDIICQLKIDDSDQLNQDEQGRLFELISWSAWNILEGPLPHHRSDDPGEKFDDFSATNCKWKAGFAKVKNLNMVMTDFINIMKAEEYKTYDEKFANRMIEFLQPVLRASTESLIHTKVIKFNKKHWDYSTNIVGRTKRRCIVQDAGASWYRWKIRELI